LLKLKEVVNNYNTDIINLKKFLLITLFSTYSNIFFDEKVPSKQFSTHFERHSLNSIY